jgi:hypothetical protein
MIELCKLTIKSVDNLFDTLIEIKEHDALAKERPASDIDVMEKKARAKAGVKSRKE